MKKILAALLLLALVFGSAAAHEFELSDDVKLELSGEVKVYADLFNVTTVKNTDEDIQGLAPEADWRIVDMDSIDWEDTIITFKVTADNYGGTFQIGAPYAYTDNDPNVPLPVNVASILRNIEAWVQPLPFLKLSMANGDTPWRAVARYKDVIDSYDIPYGTQGFKNKVAMDNGNIDEFKNGLKADIIIGEVATIEALIGVNQPLWYATGKLADVAGITGAVDTETITAGAAMVPGFNPYETGAGRDPKVWQFIHVANSASIWIPDPTGDTVVFIKRDNGLAETGVKDVSPYGRLAPNYGVRATINLEGIAKLNVNYRLGIMGKTAVLDYTATDVKLEGYDITTNQFGIFADVSPLFDGMGLPLNLVVGYTGYFESGEKVDDPKNAGKKTDAVPLYVNGIDLRVAYAVIPDTLDVALHNNATFYTLKYDKDYYRYSQYASIPSVDQYAFANDKDSTYFRWNIALGAKYVVVPEAFAVNLELANDLIAYGYYVKTNGEDKGDAETDNTFKGKLNAIVNVAENATLEAGFALAVASKHAGSDDGKALTKTTTKFSIPVAISVKF